MLFAAAVYVLSYFLPAYRLQLFSEPSYEVGWQTALFAEMIVWGLATEVASSAISGGPIPLAAANGADLRLSLVMLGGAAANHLFLLACAAALFRRKRIASASAWFAFILAVGCLTPGQLFEQEWYLGPGYFAWCAAPALLAFACGSPFHRSESPLAQPGEFEKHFDLRQPEARSNPATSPNRSELPLAANAAKSYCEGAADSGRCR